MSLSNEQREQVRVASDRITHVLDQLRQEKHPPSMLYIALVDATVRLGGFHTPWIPKAALLRGLARLALAMARDEERAPTPNQESLQ